MTTQIENLTYSELQQHLETEFISNVNILSNRALLDRAMRYAWEQGHSSGNWEVRSFYIDIAEILELV